MGPNVISQNYNDTHAQCTRCLGFLPKDNFTPDIRKHSGVSTYCRPCLSEYRRERAEETGKKYAGHIPTADKVKKDKTWFDDTHAECLTEGCGIHPKSNFYHKASAPLRLCDSYCIPCRTAIAKKERELISDEEKQAASDKKWLTTKSDMVLAWYKKYCGKRRKQGDEVDLTEEEYRALWPEDNRCPYFFIELKISRGKRTWATPSIDRVDNDKPYQKDNIEITSWRWNNLKSNSSVEERFHMGKEAAIKLGYKWPPQPAEEG
jgi:hypothetical protein